jgi:hypothetical protein
MIVQGSPARAHQRGAGELFLLPARQLDNSRSFALVSGSSQFGNCRI